MLRKQSLKGAATLAVALTCIISGAKAGNGDGDGNACKGLPDYSALKSALAAATSSETKIGGVNVFGGGLALYGTGKQIIGAIGVSGDTSCADHDIAWRVRHNLNPDHLAGVGGVSGDAAHPDNIIYDITPNPSGGTGISASGFGHPTCINTADPSTLPAVQP
jgi:hypothetical protein